LLAILGSVLVAAIVLFVLLRPMLQSAATPPTPSPVNPVVPPVDITVEAEAAAARTVGREFAATARPPSLPTEPPPTQAAPASPAPSATPSPTPTRTATPAAGR
jgi:hypothetical protein